MENNINNFLKYFTNLEDFQKEIAIDLIKDFIGSINAIEKLKKSYFNSEEKYKKLFIDLMATLKELGLTNISGFIMYKKTDFTQSKNIQNYFDISNSMNISKITLNRYIIIKELIKNNIIIDTGIDFFTIFNEKDLKKDKVIVNKNGKKLFDFSKMTINEKKLTLNVLGKQEKITKKNIGIAIILKFLKDFTNIYGEEQLNEELNMDNSYKQLLIFKADKKNLANLYSKLESGREKIYIKEIKYNKDGLYINGEKFIISGKSGLFLEILSKYFYKNPDKKEISRGTFIDFFYKNTENKKALKLNTPKNIQNSYLETINKNLGKNYINNKILEIKKDVIITK